MSYELHFNVVKFKKSQKGVNGMYKFLQNNEFQYIHAFHQDNMSVCSIPPYTPLLHYLHIFALKHIMWVLRFLCVPTIYVLSKNIKMVKKKSTENCHFYSCEKSLYIAWACFRNVKMKVIVLKFSTKFCQKIRIYCQRKHFVHNNSQ